MKTTIFTTRVLAAAIAACIVFGSTTTSADWFGSWSKWTTSGSYNNSNVYYNQGPWREYKPAPKLRNISVGPRPFYLVNDMDEGPLKDELEWCAEEANTASSFSIGHRGAPMQFPEHTKESYEAAARMGAGILECDVTFTKDRELVCRHSQCDLHTTTNILAIPELAAKCTQPFVPADPETGTPAQARCCTSDITLDEFKSLCGKMDAANKNGTTVEEYMNGTAEWRTDLYSTCGTVISHAESIELFKQLGVQHTPELKSPSVTMPFEGTYTQDDYAQQLIDEYIAARVPPSRVWPQSFDLNDVLYWVNNTPAYGRQAVFLDGRYSNDNFDYEDPSTYEPSMSDLRCLGVNVISPPMWMLLKANSKGKIRQSKYARAAKRAGLDIITWTLERDGPLANGGGWYHRSITPLINNDGDTFTVLDALASQVGVIGVFSDWPATTTYYANCMDIR